MGVGLRKVAGILIKDRRLLVVRESGKQTFFSPGGKVTEGESNENVLIRELNEELSISLDPKDLSYFDSYKAEAAEKPGMMLQMDVYMVQGYEGEIRATSEVEELAWITSQNTAGYELGSIFENYVIPELKANDLID